uniref:Podocalyxin n=2 Tax=Vombatus ursinus TaxID=29139 RepID=A0A4X2L6H7_VOMUR
MRSAPLLPPLLLVLLMLPSGWGNGATTSREVTTALATTITNAGGIQATHTSGTGKSLNTKTIQPTDSSGIKKSTSPNPTMTSSLQLQGSSFLKSSSTPKSTQGGASTVGTTAQTTVASTTVTHVVTTVETTKKTTMAPTSVPGALATPKPTLPSQAINSSPLTSAKIKDQDSNTRKTTLSFFTTSSNISGGSAPLTSVMTSTLVPGASPSVTSPATTSVTSRTRPAVATSEAPVSSGNATSDTSVGTASVASGDTASDTSGVVPSRSTAVDSENSTSSPTSPYSSHHQPPAMTTSGSEIFSPIPNKITCHADSHTTENLLILKMTNFTICDGVKDSRNHPLYTALCRAGKASFNKDRDLCHVQLVPQLEKQEVAVLHVSVQTHLQPKELYEVLKKRWDDLKVLGVSNMTYGKESLDKDVEDRFSMPLIITIVCMAAFLLLVAALYGCFHQRFTQRKDQQRLTEELQTVENGYHDNPTLEVMETSSEMQEKKVANLNGELGDSWIVPLDNLTKDDLDQEEEDTHL